MHKALWCAAVTLLRAYAGLMNINERGIKSSRVKPRKLQLMQKIHMKYSKAVEYSSVADERSQFWAPPMPACRYIEEISLGAILIAKSAGVERELNVREFVTHVSLSSMNKAAHSGFPSQRRHHQKSKTRASMAPQKKTYVLQKLKIKATLSECYANFFCLPVTTGKRQHG